MGARWGRAGDFNTGVIGSTVPVQPNERQFERPWPLFRVVFRDLRHRAVPSLDELLEFSCTG